VAAVQEAAEPAQADLAVVVVETAAEAPVVEAGLAEGLEAVGRVEEAVEADLVEEAAPVVAGELVAVRPVSRESGWPRQQCSREACWEAFRA
jgi:hypothetical protein